MAANNNAGNNALILITNADDDGRALVADIALLYSKPTIGDKRRNVHVDAALTKGGFTLGPPGSLERKNCRRAILGILKHFDTRRKKAANATLDDDEIPEAKDEDRQWHKAGLTAREAKRPRVLPAGVALDNIDIPVDPFFAPLLVARQEGGGQAGDGQGGGGQGGDEQQAGGGQPGGQGGGGQAAGGNIPPADGRYVGITIAILVVAAGVVFCAALTSVTTHSATFVDVGVSPHDRFATDVMGICATSVTTSNVWSEDGAQETLQSQELVIYKEALAECKADRAHDKKGKSHDLQITNALIQSHQKCPGHPESNQDLTKTRTTAHADLLPEDDSISKAHYGLEEDAWYSGIARYIFPFVLLIILCVGVAAFLYIFVLLRGL